MKLLLVCNHDDLRNQMTSFLYGSGHTLHLSTTVDEVMLKSESNGPDMVFFSADGDIGQVRAELLSLRDRFNVDIPVVLLLEQERTDLLELLKSEADSSLSLPLRKTDLLAVLLKYEHAHLFAGAGTSNQLFRSSESHERRDEKCRIFFEHASYMAAVIDFETKRFIDVNSVMVEKLGYGREEFSRLALTDLFQVSKPEDMDEELKSIAAGRQVVFERPCRRNDGTELFIEVKAHMITCEGDKIIYADFVDISSRKEAEKALREYEKIVCSSNDLLSFVDKDLRYRAVNDRYCEYLGRAKDEIIGHGVEEILGPANFTKVSSNIYKALGGQEVKFSQWYDLPVGRTFLNVCYSPYRDDKDTVAGLVVTIADITKLKLASQAISHSEIIYREMFEDNPASIFIYELETLDLVEANKYAIKHCGYSVNELLSMSIKDLYDDPELHLMLRNATSDPVAHISNVRTFGGAEAVYKFIVRSIFYKGRPTGFVVVYDISENARLEKRHKRAISALKKMRYETNELFSIAKSILRDNSLKKAARAIIDAGAALTGSTAGNVAVLREGANGSEFVLLEAAGRGCTVYPELIIPVASLKSAACNRDVVIINNFSNSLLRHQFSSGQFRLENVLLAPLSIDEALAGVLVLADKPDRFTRNDKRIAGNLGEMASLALKIAKVSELHEKREKEHRVVADTVHDGIVSFNSVGDITSWNAAAGAMFGYNRNEILGKNIEMLLAARGRITHLGRLMAAAKSDIGGRGIEAQVLARDGHEITVDIRLSKWIAGHEAFYTAVIRNIAAGACRKDNRCPSYERFRIIFNLSKDFIWETDADLRYTFVNDKMCNALGYSTGDMLGKSPFDFMLPEQASAVEKTFREQAQKKDGIKGVSFAFQSRTGRLIKVQSNAAAVLDDSGGFSGYVGIDNEVDGLESQPLKPGANEKLYKWFFESSSDGLVIADPDGRIVAANRMMAVLLGLKSSEHLVGGNYSEYLTPDAWKTTKEHILAAWDQTFSGVYNIEMQRDDGTRFQASARVYIQNDKEQLVLYSLRDASERVKLEAENAEMLNNMKRLIRQLQCISIISALTKICKGLDDFLLDVLNIVPMGLTDPTDIMAWINYEDKDYKIYDSPESELFLESALVINGSKKGFVRLVDTKASKDSSCTESNLDDMQYLELITNSIAESIAFWQQQEALYAYQNRMNELVKQLSRIEDRERKSISDFLHDKLIQKLSLTQMNLSLAKADPIQENYPATVESASSSIGEVINDMRSLIYEVSPTRFFEISFVDAIEYLAEQFTAKHSFDVDVKYNSRDFILPTEHSNTLYKAVRELLFNSLKHSGVKAATVEVHYADGFVCINVCDLGRGFEYHKNFFIEKKYNFGLFNVKHGIESIGGSMRICSGKSSKTCITLSAMAIEGAR